MSVEPGSGFGLENPAAMSEIESWLRLNHKGGLNYGPPKRKLSNEIMIMMNSPRDGYAQFMNWPKEILKADFEPMDKVAQKLRKAGDSKTTSMPERNYLLVKPESPPNRGKNGARSGVL